MIRLISFLGTGTYHETNYVLEEKTPVQTHYIADALARIFEVDELYVIATPSAWCAHGKFLQAALPPTISFKRCDIPDGQSDTELWGQFEVLRDAITEGGIETVILDITHGFRAQPFFAAGVLTQLSASGQLPEDTRIFYGEYRRDELDSPVWDISLFVELLSWAQGSALMRQTGNSRLLVETLRREYARQEREISAAGKQELPKTPSLIRAIEQFSKDLTTTRVASLITGYKQCHKNKHKALSSAEMLLQALSEYRDEPRAWSPALVPMLDSLRELAEGIAAPTLQGEEGLKAMQQLATRYLELERYSEAATVMREGWISAYGDAGGVEVNSDVFSQKRRAETEDYWWNNSDTSDLNIAEIRNDIQHGGFNKQPLGSSVLQERIRECVSKFSEIKLDPLQDPVTGKTWFVSRHPGAIEWANRQGIQVDNQTAHLDMEQLQSGDTVIGTLPVHLVFQLSEMKCHYQHLSLDIPANLRGKEMDADMLEQCNARLEDFRVVRETP